MQLLDLVVTDDRGRRYSTALIDENHDRDRLDGAYAIGPGIPTDASELVVRIQGVGDPRKPDDAVQGPWEFGVQVSHPLASAHL